MLVLSEFRGNLVIIQNDFSLEKNYSIILFVFVNDLEGF